MDKELQFPIYRKLSNNKSYYRIDGLDHFVELKMLGNKFLRYEINARQYPEKLRILDMIDLAIPFLSATEEEFKQHEL
ncbi:MAG: hypothetical protein V4638_05785 [Bacteroidota bacterium]